MSGHEVAAGPRVVLVVGGSSGIGLAVVRLLVDRGDTVAVLSRAPGVLHRDDPVLRLTADVTDASTVHSAVAEAVTRLGRLDAVVHTAQPMVYGRIEQVPSEALGRVVEVGAVGTANLARAVLPVFRRQGGGTFVVVSSLLADLPVPALGAYVSAKAAQRALVRVLRLETRHERGVQVCLVSPAAVDTPVYDRAATWTGRHGSPPPPVVAPDKVAHAVLRCLERPRPHVRVGGRLPLLGYRLLPGLYDRLVGPVGARVLHRGEAVGPSDGDLWRSQHPDDPAAQVARAGWRWSGRRPRGPRSL